MNDEQAKLYLFERIPALVQCHPEAIHAYLGRHSSDDYTVFSYMTKYSDTVVCKMEIPRDEDGNLYLKARFSYANKESSNDEMVRRYVGMTDHGLFIDGSFHNYWEYMTPIYPETKPELVPWSDEDLIGFKCKGEGYIGVISKIHPESEYIYIGGAGIKKDIFFKNYTQLDGKPFMKETK